MKVYSFLLLSYFFFVFTPVYGVVLDPGLSIKKVEKEFFNPIVVQQALSMYHVPQSLWNSITQDLHKKSLQVSDRLKQKTSRMSSNPLAYPMQKTAAAKLIREMLSEVFMESMDTYQIDPFKARLIFDRVFFIQSPLFVECLEIEMNKLSSKLP